MRVALLIAAGLARPPAPANADEAVRRAVREAGGHVTGGRVTKGTLEAYRQRAARKTPGEKRPAPAAP
jgi:hypothetical protein